MLLIFCCLLLFASFCLASRLGSRPPALRTAMVVSALLFFLFLLFGPAVLRPSPRAPSERPGRIESDSCSYLTRIDSTSTL